MTDVEIIGLLKTYVNKTLVGGGALKGKNCTIDSIAPITGGNRVTFKWTLDDGTVETGHLDVMNGLNGQDGQDGQDGKGIQSVSVNAENHLIITYSDGTTTDAGQIEIHSAVDSVNGKTGTVVLDAEDVGALPDDTPIPAKTSDLTNDSGFITKAVNDLVNYYLKSETYSKTQVDDIITAVKNSRFEVVATLPTTDIKTNVIYLVPKSPSQTSNVKDEYINLDGTTAGWEKIGDTEIDLSGYVTTEALNTALADYTTTADLTTLLAAKQDTLTFDNAPTENSDNPVKSNGIYVANRNIYEVMGQNSAKNFIPFDLDRIKAKNTTGTWNGNVYSLNGIDFTFNSDGTVDASGTATETASVHYYDPAGLPPFGGDRILRLTGCPSGGGSGTTYKVMAYRAGAVDGSTGTAEDYGDGISLRWLNDGSGVKAFISISVYTGAGTIDLTFKPMLRLSTDTDNTFVPYAKTNKQLTDDSVDWDNMAKIGSINVLKNIATTTIHEASGITATVNADNSITFAPTSNTYPYTLPQRIIVDLTKAKPYFPYLPCKLSGCPSGGSTDAGSGYSIYYANYVDVSGIVVDGGNGAIIKSEFDQTTYPNARIMARINAGVTLTEPLTFKPMITPIDYNGDYVPYAMTNRELTKYIAPITGKYVVTRQSYRKTISASNTKTRSQLMKEFYDDFVTDVVTPMGSHDMIAFLNGSAGAGGGACRMPYPFSKGEANTVTVVFSDVDLTASVIATYEITFTHDATTCTSYDNRIPIGTNVTVTHNDKGAEIPTSGDLVLYFVIYQAIE